MYFKEHLPILRRHDLCNLSHCLVTEIRVGKNASSRSRCQSCDKFDTFYSNFDLFLSNMNDLNPASLIVVSDLNARNSKWWSSDKQNFEVGAIHSSTTSAGYTQLTDQPTHIISNSFSCIDVVFASNPNGIYNSSVEGIKLYGTWGIKLYGTSTSNLQEADVGLQKADAECIRRCISSVD